jgi:7,8-dihydro-6-hydroxymethylpterin dimethyltransferase
MENRGEVLYETESLCPQCLCKIKATAVKRGGSVYLEKECGEHGAFSTVIWRGSPDIEKWRIDKIPSTPPGYNFEEDKGCPFDCGLCEDHKQHTCTMLLEVTKRCNLKCNVCFADSGGMSVDPDLDKIRYFYNRALEQGGPYNVQLSGGEPTVRDDLPEIIRIGKEYGFEFIQVNTNGIRIAEDEAYVEELRSAGLNSIFLQFDGLSDEIYKKLRGRELFEIKKKAIENCRKYNIGVILVPVLFEENLNDTVRIIDFALENIDVVRGVHFQPISFFGRYSEDMEYNKRITLPEIMQSIEDGSRGGIKISDFAPPCCEHSLCSFHGNFIYEEGELKPIVKKSCCDQGETIKAEDGSAKSKQFVKKYWGSREVKLKDPAEDRISQSFERILNRINSKSFSISAMAFQDAWNVDIERLKQCCIHVMSEDGNLIPFCAYNMTDVDSNYLYRRR